MVQGRQDPMEAVVLILVAICFQKLLVLRGFPGLNDRFALSVKDVSYMPLQVWIPLPDIFIRLDEAIGPIRSLIQR